MEEQGVHLDELRTTAAELAQDGKTPLYFAQSQTLLGIISVSDVKAHQLPGHCGNETTGAGSGHAYRR